MAKNLVFKMVLKKKEVPRAAASPSIQKLSHEMVGLIPWDLPLSGIHSSSLDGSAKLVDVARHLMSSAEATVTAAFSNETRPDTRPIPVADGRAGAEMRVFPLLNSSVTDGPTDGRTDRSLLKELRVRM